MCGNLHACILDDTSGVAISRFVAICRPHIFFTRKGGYSSICSNINSHLLSFTCGHFSVCGNLQSHFSSSVVYSLTFPAGFAISQFVTICILTFSSAGVAIYSFRAICSPTTSPAGVTISNLQQNAVAIFSLLLLQE